MPTGTIHPLFALLQRLDNGVERGGVERGGVERGGVG